MVTQAEDQGAPWWAVSVMQPAWSSWVWMRRGTWRRVGGGGSTGWACWERKVGTEDEEEPWWRPNATFGIYEDWLRWQRPPLSGATFPASPPPARATGCAAPLPFGRNPSTVSRQRTGTSAQATAPAAAAEWLPAWEPRRGHDGWWTGRTTRNDARCA